MRERDGDWERFECNKIYVMRATHRDDDVNDKLSNIHQVLRASNERSFKEPRWLWSCLTVLVALISRNTSNYSHYYSVSFRSSINSFFCCFCGDFLLVITCHTTQARRSIVWYISSYALTSQSSHCNWNELITKWNVAGFKISSIYKKPSTITSNSR